MSPNYEPGTRQNPLAFSFGGGERGQRIRKLDWSQIPLGPSSSATGAGLWRTRRQLQLGGGRLAIEWAPGKATRATIMAPPGAEVQPEEAGREAGETPGMEASR